MAGLKPLRTVCGVLVLLSVAGAKVDAQPFVKTPFINEFGSGWFFSLAAGSTCLYASDHSLNCIRKLEADTGVRQQWAGECASDSAGHQDGLRCAAKFKQPRSICINPKGQLIVADQGNHCIRAVSPEGVVSTYAGVCGKAGEVDGNAAEALFSDVWDVQCLDNCSVLVAEPGSVCIRTIQDSSGTCPDPAESTAGDKQHWLKQKSVWATLVAVAVASAVMGSAITFFADAQAAKRHTALLDNMERYQALGGSEQVTLRTSASGSPAAEGVKNDQQSMLTRVRAYCAKLFPVTGALRVAPHAGANPAVEAGGSHQSGTLDQQARGATQDATILPDAEEASRADQLCGLAMGPEAQTSTSTDVFNVFDSPDDTTGNDNVQGACLSLSQRAKTSPSNSPLCNCTMVLSRPAHARSYTAQRLLDVDPIPKS